MLFGVPLFFLLLFGDSSIGLLLLPLLLVLIGLFSFIGKWRFTNKIEGLDVAILVTAMIVVVVSFFTTHIPLTLVEITRFFGALLIFLWFFHSTDPRVTQKSVGLAVIGSALVLVVVHVVLVLANATSLVSDISILQSMFGHNHISAVMLLALPLSWYFFLSQKPRTKSWLLWSGIILIFYVTLITSLGRVAVLIALLQIAFIPNEKKKTVMQVAAFLCVVTLSIYTAFSVHSIPALNKVCETTSFLSKLCKPVVKESRPAYWQQAIRATLDRPLTGYGLGTFTVISTKYRQTPYVVTTFAHNHYVQWLAELGLVAGLLVVGLFLFLLFKMGKTYYKAPKTSFERFAGIAVFSMAINAFFDFDLSFIGVFLITLILIALSIKKKEAKEASSGKLSISMSGLPTVVNGLMLAIGGSVVMMYTIVEVLLIQNMVNQAVSFFPYFPQHQNIFLASSLSTASKNRLLGINAHDSSNLLQYLHEHVDVADVDTVIQLKNTLHRIDPWQLQYQSAVNEKIHEGMYADALAEILEATALFKKSGTCCRFHPGYEVIRENDQRLAKLLPFFFTLKDNERAVTGIRALAQSEPAAVSELGLFESATDASFIMKVLNALNDVPAQVLFADPELFEMRYREMVLASIQNGEEREMAAVLSRYEQLFSHTTTDPILFSDYIKTVLLDDLVAKPEIHQKDEPFSQLLALLVAKHNGSTTAAYAEIVESYKAYDERNSKTDRFMARAFQNAIDERVKSRNWNEAAVLSRQLQVLFPKDYWVMAELGTVQQLQALDTTDQEKLKEAEQSFADCVTAFSPNRHDDCAGSKDSLYTYTFNQAYAQYLKLSSRVKNMP